MEIRDWRGDLGKFLGGVGVSRSSIDIGTQILSGLIEEQSEDPFRGFRDKRKKIGKDGARTARGWINFIPSDTKGPCSDLLVVAYNGNKELEKFSMEAIETSISCHKTMKAVVFAGDVWDDTMFTQWRKRAFDNLHDSFGVCLASVIMVGGRWSVTPIIY
jgi:hypothetical protein